MELVEILADDEYPVCRMLTRQMAHHAKLRSVGRGEAVAALLVGERILQAGVVIAERDANLHAGRLGYEPLLLEDAPGHIVLLGTDEAEDLVLFAILTHERCGKAQTTAALQVGDGAEDRRGQQVDLVVDDEAPVVLVEDMEVGEGVGLLLPVRQDLVGRDGDRLDLLPVARILANLLREERRLVEDLVAPLPERGDVGGEDKRMCLHLAHGADADDCLARATWKRDNTRTSALRAAGVEGVHRLDLVGAEAERASAAGRGDHIDLERGPGLVAGEVFDGVANLDQRMLHKAAFGDLHLHATVLDRAEQEGGDEPVHADFGQDDGVVGGDGEVLAIGHQLEPAVARHVVVHIGEDIARHLILGEGEELPLHLLGLPAERRGVPEGERGDPVGVDVFG